MLLENEKIKQHQSRLLNILLLFFFYFRINFFCEIAEMGNWNIGSVRKIDEARQDDKRMR